MTDQHEPNWAEAGGMLHDALEHYRDLKKYVNLTRAIDDIANFMPGRRGEPLSDKTVRRDMSGESIPDRRVEFYAQWLHEKAKLPREWIAEWLEQTAYSRPGELLAQVCDAGGTSKRSLLASRKMKSPPCEDICGENSWAAR